MADSAVSMSSKRYTDEFKIEAVRQVSDRGFKVAEVAERLGVTTRSVYAWLRTSLANLARSPLGESARADFRLQKPGTASMHNPDTNQCTYRSKQSLKRKADY